MVSSSKGGLVVSFSANLLSLGIESHQPVEYFFWTTMTNDDHEKDNSHDDEAIYNNYNYNDDMWQW